MWSREERQEERMRAGRKRKEEVRKRGGRKRRERKKGKEEKCGWTKNRKKEAA